MKKRSFHSTIAANGVLSDFPNVKAIRREERNCLKHLINGKAAFATLSTGFGKCLIFPQTKRALERRQDGMPLTIVVISLFIEIIKDQVQNLNKTGVAAAMIGEDNTDAFKVKLQNCKLRIMVLEGRSQNKVKKVRKASCAYCY